MNNTISITSTVLDALMLLDSLSSNQILTLLVVDNEGKLSGTLTDGDLRRYIVRGGLLSDEIGSAVTKSFFYVDGSKNIVEQLHKIKGAIKDIKIIPYIDKDGRILDVINLAKFKSYLPIDAVLMAGGKGERLRPLTEKTPKPLLKVGDKCIIDHNVDRLIEYGIKHISVTVNYLKEQLEEHYESPRGDVKVSTVAEPQFLGTIGSIKFVPKFYNDVVLVMNSDLFTNIDYEDFYLHFMQHDADMSVAAVPYNVSIPYGILDLEGRNIQGLLEKPRYTYYANAGIYMIRRSALDEIPDGEFFNATDLIEKLIGEGKTVIRYPLNGTWIDIGNPQEYQKAQDLVKHLK